MRDMKIWCVLFAALAVLLLGVGHGRAQDSGKVSCDVVLKYVKDFGGQIVPLKVERLVGETGDTVLKGDNGYIFVVPTADGTRELFLWQAMALLNKAWWIRVPSSDPGRRPVEQILAEHQGGCLDMPPYKTMADQNPMSSKVLTPTETALEKTPCASYVARHLAKGGAVYPVRMTQWDLSSPIVRVESEFYQKENSVYDIDIPDTLKPPEMAVAALAQTAWMIIYPWEMASTDGSAVFTFSNGEKTRWAYQLITVPWHYKGACMHIAIGPTPVGMIAKQYRQKLGLERK